MPLQLLPPILAVNKMSRNLDGGKFYELIQYTTLLIMLSRASNMNLTHCYFMNFNRLCMPALKRCLYALICCVLWSCGESDALSLNLNNSTSQAVGGEGQYKVFQMWVACYQTQMDTNGLAPGRCLI
ncbi:hypothetical protein Bca4012_062693 [Brassica carinata]|uniref:Uncharacterized protein n=1 Tax=Brassica carinata TaxID=52824 RepID=A0A8X7UB62_BRACI|nr:hypothetical protein Bca52824_064231 [Brassica carinata]